MHPRRGFAASEAKKNCGTWCATAQLEDGSYVAVPLTCRQWDCSTCGPRLKRRLTRRLEYARPTLFITLTTSLRTKPTPDEAFHVANAAIAILFKRWKRRFPDAPFEYFLVWERTKAGWPHAHILLKAPRVSKHWLSNQWRQLTGSYIIDLQPVSSNQHAARYLAKYLAKDPTPPPGFRRFRRSAGFFNSAEEPPRTGMATLGPWTRQPRHAFTQAYIWLRDGLAVSLDPDGMVRARGDPAEHYRQMGTGLPFRLQTLAFKHDPVLAY